MQDIIIKFIDAMRQSGFEPERTSDIKADGSDHYIKAKGDKKDGRLGYCLTICPDGFAYGNFRNFRTGEAGIWHSKLDSSDPAEIERYKKRVKREELEREDKKRKKWDEVAKECQAFWDISSDAPEDHPYLTKKQIKPYTLRIDGDALLAPLYYDFKLMGIQRIYADGSKYHWKDARKQGCWYEIQGNAEKVLLCEGVATGHTLHEATGFKTYVCYDAANIVQCVERIAKLNQESIIIICADNDNLSVNSKGEPFNAGVYYGQKAASMVSGFCVYPEQDDSDFNDVGKEYSAKVIHGVKKYEIELPPDDVYEREFRSAPFQIELDSSNSPPVWDEEKIRERMIWKKLPTAKDPIGEPESGMTNIMLYMRHYETLERLFRYDEFAGQVVLHRCPFWVKDKDRFKVRRVHDADLTYIVEWFEKRRIKSTKEKIADAIDVIARENRINPPREYFESLKWDGKPRLDKWLSYYLGADGQPSEYLAKVGACWLISGVARIYRPGCKVDTMLVLEGEQGAMKSTALEVLANVGSGELEESYFCDTLNFGKIHDKDALMMLQGKLIVEFAELSKLGDREIEEVKQWMTNKVDECRRPYARLVEQFPRQFILTGSTNNSTYLRDKTGNRRFWPVKCGEVFDVAALRADREQIWAEAVHRFKAGEKWWIERDDPVMKIAKEEQLLRTLEDAWEANVSQAIEGKEVVSVSYIMGEIGLDMAQRNTFSTNRITSILQSMGWKNAIKYSKTHKKSMRGWWNPSYD